MLWGCQAAVVALKNRAPLEDSVAVISRKLSVSLRPQFSITTFSLSEPDEPADAAGNLGSRVAREAV
jgi:hypothetical protein